MTKDISDIRKDYQKGKLDKDHVKTDPLDQFKDWMDAAMKSDLLEPTAVTLSTADKNGIPSSRTVLLKGVENGGFIIYTNYESIKGTQMTENPWAALTFHWAELERQVNISGKVEKVDPKTSDEYFNSRPRKSRLGAWASYQSQELENRRELVGRFAKLSVKYAGRDVPRPPHWGGFIIIPQRIEFWQGRPSRLHDRIEYARNESGDWTIKRLSP